MRILNVNQTYQVRGGSGRYMLDLERLLTAKGHTVVPFAATDPENLPTEWSRFFPKAVDFGSPRLRDLPSYVWSQRARRAIDALTDAADLDLAHLHIYYGKLTASILDVLVKKHIKVVQTVHDFKLVCPAYQLISGGEVCTRCEGHKFWKVIPNRCNRGSLARSTLSAVESYVSRGAGSESKVDHFIAVSDFQRALYVKLGVDPTRITTVPHGIDLTLVPARTSYSEYLLYYGRIERVKGVFTLVDAMTQHPDLRLVIAGRGEAAGELAAYVGDEGIANVEIVGWMSGDWLNRLIADSMAVVVPSESYETFGLSTIEAMGRGVPVVVSDMGAMKDIVSDGVDGFVHRSGDADDLAGTIGRLRDAPDILAMGKAGRTKVEERFNMDLHYERLMAVYEQVLSS